MLPIIEKYNNALQFFKNKSDNPSQTIYNLLLTAGKPNFIINSKKRSLTCLIIGGVIGQKIPFIRARNIRSQLYSKLGVEFNVEDLETIDNDTWKNMKLEDFQIKTINELIKSHHNKDISLEDFDMIDEIIKVKGIGQWTIDNIKIMYMVGNYKILPDNILLQHDYIIKKALKRIYNVDIIGMVFIKKIKQEWYHKENNENYTGIVNWYIWRYAPGIIY